MNQYDNKIKVDKKIKPLSIKDRITPDLKVGEQYYISFGKNNVYPCTLLEIIDNISPATYLGITTEFPKKQVRISCKLKIRKKFRGSGYDEHQVYAIEIGRTPEEAVKNEVHL